jgi:hypothetical protein
MMAAGGGPARQGELSRWAAKIVAARHGTAVQEHSVDGPPAQGLEVTFEQPPVGVPGVTLSTVLVAWRLSEIVFGAELTYIKGDPHSADYERTLLGVVRSFRRP